MQIIEKNTTELKPYDNNPRYNEEAVRYVAKSIGDFGFNVPIVIDKNDVIVAGHTRLKAAKMLGLEKVPCVRVDNLTEEQVKAYRLADNRTSEYAEWEYDLLEIELQDISIDMGEYGFEAELDAFELLDEVGYGDEEGEQETFDMTFTFEKQYETLVKEYTKKNGKKKIVQMIVDMCKGETNAD